MARPSRRSPLWPSWYSCASTVGRRRRPRTGPSVRRVWAFAPLVALLFVGAAAGFVLLRHGERATITDGLVGRPAPAFALAALDESGTITPAAFAGRPYLVNFFASWC